MTGAPTSTQSPQAGAVPGPPVLLTLAGGIAQLELNRPNRANAMDVALLRELHERILAIHADPEVRVVVLSGRGRNFCAGGDVKTFAERGTALPAYLREATAWLQLSVAALNQLSVPVVAAVQGSAAGGGGLGLVCAADVVIAAENASFTSGAVAVGMAPDAGVTVSLPQLIGMRRATEMLLLGRKLSAEEAQEWGLVTALAPPERLAEQALDTARALAAAPRESLAATKRLLWTGLGTSVADRLPEEARIVAELSGSADAREGLAAVIERRPPRFRGREVLQ